MDHYEPRIIVTSRASWAESEGRALRRRLAAGELARLRRAVVQPSLRPLSELPWIARPDEALQRYLDRISAVAATRRRDVVFSHESALAIHGFPLIGDWPEDVHVVEPVTTARRSKHGVVVHRARLRDEDVVEWMGVHVTSVARTLADLARGGDAMTTVVALDHALGQPEGSAGHTGKEQVAAIVESLGSWGRPRALALVAFADGRSGSPGESGSRVRFAELGFEIPDLQVRHRMPDGSYFDTDFKWRNSRKNRPLIGEFDGLGKYLKDDQLGGLSPGQAVVKEKRREDALRALDGSDFMRWGMPEVRHPHKLRALADLHGVPRAPRAPKRKN